MDLVSVVGSVVTFLINGYLVTLVRSSSDKFDFSLVSCSSEEQSCYQYFYESVPEVGENTLRLVSLQCGTIDPNILSDVVYQLGRRYTGANVIVHDSAATWSRPVADWEI